MHWISRLSRFDAYLLIVVITLTVAGCDDSLPPPGPGPEDIINDVTEMMRYYPMNQGDMHRYAVTGGPEFVFEVVDLSERQGGPAVTIDVTRQGETTTEYKRWNGPNLLSALNSDFTREQKELAGPFYTGARWRRINETTENSTFYIDCEILDLRHEVTVEAGTFEAMWVQLITTGEFPPAPAYVDTSYMYYAADVGIVKMDIETILFTLLEYIPGEGSETNPGE